jgi:hypothetical protein
MKKVGRMVWVLSLTVVPYHPGIGVDPLEGFHPLAMSIMKLPEEITAH